MDAGETTSFCSTVDSYTWILFFLTVVAGQRGLGFVSCVSHVPRSRCEDKRIACESWFSPDPTWAPGI